MPVGAVAGGSLGESSDGELFANVSNTTINCMIYEEEYRLILTGIELCRTILNPGITYAVSLVCLRVNIVSINGADNHTKA